VRLAAPRSALPSRGDEGFRPPVWGRPPMTPAGRRTLSELLVPRRQVRARSAGRPCLIRVDPQRGPMATRGRAICAARPPVGARRRRTRAARRRRLGRATDCPAADDITGRQGPGIRRLGVSRRGVCVGSPTQRGSGLGALGALAQRQSMKRPLKSSQPRRPPKLGASERSE